MALAWSVLGVPSWPLRCELSGQGGAERVGGRAVVRVCEDSPRYRAGLCSVTSTPIDALIEAMSAVQAARLKERLTARRA